MSAGMLENEWVEENPQKFSAGELSKIKARALVWTNLAKQWANNLKTWTLVKDGYWGQNYFERIEVGGPMGYNPNYHEKIMIHNKKPNEAAFFTEDAILDGGFLQWIMAGLVDPNDLDFSNTLYIYDTHLRKSTSYGKGYVRYNEDAYGANHKGGAWPILSAERGIVAIMRNEYAEEHLQFIRQSASSAGLIPEQDTMSVRPLAWSHAAYLIFLKSLAEKDSFYKMK